LIDEVPPCPSTFLQEETTAKEERPKNKKSNLFIVHVY